MQFHYFSFPISDGTQAHAFSHAGLHWVQLSDGNGAKVSMSLFGPTAEERTRRLAAAINGALAKAERPPVVPLSF